MIKADQTFDKVHDSQRTFRVLLDCMARPGKIGALQIEVEAEFISSGLLQIALTLLDREVSFSIMAKEKEKIRRYLKWNTFSEESEACDADYLFIDTSLTSVQIAEVMRNAKRGTLADPHQSATFVVYIEELFAEDIGLRLSGPGIKNQRQVALSKHIERWLGEREMVNEEYPLGVDMIFVNSVGELLALPRTTKVERVDEQWVM
ncbi:phosphonate C-P lyase system protein PhnH [Bacillus suaedae]|uniref:Phosphonate C-P lyase system protein PhnH n=1 Tax=Halalkalibacter suaedae TaxID=2822140 RepID=A0A940X0F3_9BACI|nr:phosphonate C-P lyase system protein PhnH [Bacillus suaedae]MBP3952695.1 phosphonate C-P lyase system protein PhnH [Bacillus suaedae]